MNHKGKLVRDQIDHLMKQAGKKPITRILDDEEYEVELKLKIIEEAKELYEAKADSVLEEIVDILEVIEALCELYQFTPNQIETLQKQKRQTRGGFKRRLYLEASE